MKQIVLTVAALFLVAALTGSSPVKEINSSSPILAEANQHSDGEVWERIVPNDWGEGYTCVLYATNTSGECILLYVTIEYEDNGDRVVVPKQVPSYYDSRDRPCVLYKALNRSFHHIKIKAENCL